MKGNVILPDAWRQSIATQRMFRSEPRLKSLRWLHACAYVGAFALLSVMVPTAIGQVPPQQASSAAVQPKLGESTPARTNTEIDRQASLPLPGTLFTTREQRDKLDRTRRLGGIVEDETIAPIEPRASVINGFVKRSDGRDTVWVDNVMRRDPRAEAVGQLEPNMVGGLAGLANGVTAFVPLANSKTSVGTYGTARAKEPSQKVRRKPVRRR